MKIAYWVATVLLSLMMVISASMYVFNHKEIETIFTSLGYPTYLIYPLAIAKLLGITILLTRFNKTFVEWAYAGFTLNFLLAVGAHIGISDGEWLGAVLAAVFLTTSYFTGKKIRA